MKSQQAALAGFFAFFLCALTSLAGIPTPGFDATIGNQTVPVGKTLVVPVAAHSGTGKMLTYLVTSSDKAIMVRAKTGNPFLKVHVSYPGVSGTDAASTYAAFSGDMI